MTSKLTITRERIELIANFHRAMTLPPSHDEIEELARMALAAMESEPVIIVGDDGGDALSYRRLIQSFAPGTKLYRHAPPAPERDQVRREHAEWSQATFGNVGPVGPLKHLSKEALEAAAEPDDLSEWADMQFLLWDAQRRAGITDEQITQAMIEKLSVNKQRDWPEPKDGEPRLHIKEQPAPVVPEDIPDSVYDILCQACGGKAWMYEEALWNACRAAMLQSGNSPVIGIDLASGPDRSVEVRYVAPPGYVMVPKEPTSEMQSAGASAIRIETTAVNKLWTGNAVYWAMLAAAPQEVK